jgi:hypothetical protein
VPTIFSAAITFAKKEVGTPPHLLAHGIHVRQLYTNPVDHAGKLTFDARGRDEGQPTYRRARDQRMRYDRSSFAD